MELKLALRLLRRRWVASAATIVTVALSVAVTCALFSVVDGLTIRPLPFAAADRLVSIDWRRQPNGAPTAWLLGPDRVARMNALRLAIERSPFVEAATQATPGLSPFPRDAAADAGLSVSGADSRFLDVFGLRTVVGSGFTSDHERDSVTAAPRLDLPLPVILGEELSRRLYGSAAAALGVKDLGGRRVRIVGVMEAGVRFPGETNVWVPMASDSALAPPRYARMRPGASVAQLAASAPDLDVQPLGRATRLGNPTAIELLFAAAALLLVVTWVQVASLTISATLSQIRELGIRLALGASRGRLARQLVTQNGVLGVAAFVLAWMATQPLTRFVIDLIPADLRRGQHLDPDLRTFGFGVGLSLVGLLLLTAVSIAFARCVTPRAALAGGIDHHPARAERWRQRLLAGQMALTALLLYLSGLALHSFVAASTDDYGIDTQRVLLLTPPSWTPAFGSPVAAYRQAFDRYRDTMTATVDALHGVPGVVAVAGFSTAPLGAGSAFPATPISSFDNRPVTGLDALDDVVSADVVRTLGARIIAGLDFTDPQLAGRDDLALVNETLARRLVGAAASGDGLPIAGTVVGRTIGTVEGTCRIVGVFRDLVQARIGTTVEPELFVLRRHAAAHTVIAVRLDPSFEPAVRATVQRLWGRLSARQVEWMSEARGRALAPFRNQSLMLALIAGCGLPIAAIGLVGTLLFSVRVREHEIAIRVAMGAEPRDISRLVGRRALGVVAIGLIVGCVAGAIVGRGLAHQWIYVSSVDAATLGGVAGVLIILAWAASGFPARQGARIDPAVVLRRP